LSIPRRPLFLRPPLQVDRPAFSPTGPSSAVSPRSFLSPDGRPFPFSQPYAGRSTCRFVAVFLPFALPHRRQHFFFEQLARVSFCIGRKPSLPVAPFRGFLNDDPVFFRGQSSPYPLSQWHRLRTAAFFFPPPREAEDFTPSPLPPLLVIHPSPALAAEASLFP